MNPPISLSTTLGEAIANQHRIQVHEGEGSLVGDEEYVRLLGTVSCTLTKAVDLSDPNPYLKLISCLIFTESLYSSSVSYKVIQTLSTGLYKQLRDPEKATPGGMKGSSKISVCYKFYTRTPCIRPSDLRLVGGAAVRCFNVIGNADRCGFLEYKFEANYRHLRSNDVGRVEQEYHSCIEDHLSDLKCKEVMERISSIRKQFTQFRLSDYLSILNFSHKGRQLGRHQAFPDGWLTSSLEGTAGPSASGTHEIPRPKRSSRVLTNLKSKLSDRKKK
ncbi:MAG: ORF3 [Elisy virus]|uniref:ORF3 n=1 Tax=Elisy virus TaxID=2800914 RepID=A0A894KPJ9_9RHAB|nr:MAG: ORF3 [Elisy virus]